MKIFHHRAYFIYGRKNNLANANRREWIMVARRTVSYCLSICFLFILREFYMPHICKKPKYMSHWHERLLFIFERKCIWNLLRIYTLHSAYATKDWEMFLCTACYSARHWWLSCWRRARARARNLIERIVFRNELQLYVLSCTAHQGN